MEGFPSSAWLITLAIEWTFKKNVDSSYIQN